MSATIKDQIRELCAAIWPDKRTEIYQYGVGASTRHICAENSDGERTESLTPDMPLRELRAYLRGMLAAKTEANK